MGERVYGLPASETIPSSLNPGMKAREDKGRLPKKPSFFREGWAFSVIFPSA